jgi:hypothetical protein
MSGFPNRARDGYEPETDKILAAELDMAGITHNPQEESCVRLITKGHEVETGVMGFWNGWKFERAWYYWVCTGPGIPLKEAELLHAKFGKDVRVDGDCSCPSPRERFKGLACGSYHVDSQAGLNALAATIKGLVEQALYPDYAFLGKEGDVAIRKIGGGCYYRDAGDWMVRTHIVDGKLLVNMPPESDMARFNGLEIVGCSELEWKASNGNKRAKDELAGIVPVMITIDDLAAMPEGTQKTPGTRLWYGVHSSHCCVEHGCKYGDADCPVENGKIAGIKCERCEAEHVPY